MVKIRMLLSFQLSKRHPCFPICLSQTQLCKDQKILYLFWLDFFFHINLNQKYISGMPQPPAPPPIFHILFAYIQHGIQNAYFHFLTHCQIMFLQKKNTCMPTPTNHCQSYRLEHLIYSSFCLSIKNECLSYMYRYIKRVPISNEIDVISTQAVGLQMGSVNVC